MVTQTLSHLAPTKELTYPPEVYRAESARWSRFWTTWFPYIVAVAMIFIAWLAPEFMAKWLVSETTGIVEFLHALIPLIIAFIALRMLLRPSLRAEHLRTVWCVALVLGGVWLAGEEASWGQHYLDWVTPEGWSRLNDQGETNFHNVSHWLDQKPRLILVTGIAVTGIFMPYILLHRPGWLPRSFDFTYAPLALVPLAILVVLSGFYDEAADAYGPKVMKSLRGGEFQELFIVWYLLAYTLTLRERADLIETDWQTAAKS